MMQGERVVVLFGRGHAVEMGLLREVGRAERFLSVYEGCRPECERWTHVYLNETGPRPCRCTLS